MIMAIVNQGYSEEVMAAAKTAGATGGTVFQSRRVGSEDTIKFGGDYNSARTGNGTNPFPKGK